jgi:hypothetical protein
LVTIIVILFVENKNVLKRKQVEKERENLITELQEAFTKIKTLRGFRRLLIRFGQSGDGSKVSASSVI